MRKTEYLFAGSTCTQPTYVNVFDTYFPFAETQQNFQCENIWWRSFSILTVWSSRWCRSILSPSHRGMGNRMSERSTTIWHEYKIPIWISLVIRDIVHHQVNHFELTEFVRRTLFVSDSARKSIDVSCMLTIASNAFTVCSFNFIFVECSCHIYTRTRCLYFFGLVSRLIRLS